MLIDLDSHTVSQEQNLSFTSVPKTELWKVGNKHLPKNNMNIEVHHPAH